MKFMPACFAWKFKENINTDFNKRFELNNQTGVP